ncbi:S-layer homology domain-containing protein [Paenibacillaceae bacterium]|nr:S-layer homology domain-containing protein [Paenibacillaceae bacterium]
MLRALGRSCDQASSKQWNHQYYSDGTFRPNHTVTRAELQLY